jgi:hypothetical protein
MSGVAIIGELLRTSETLVAKVPAPQIKAGALPEGAPLPSLLVRTVSVIERQKLKRTGMVRTIARISVTVRAENYRDQGAIIKLVIDACAGFVGDLAGAFRVSVLTAGTGPDVIGPGNSFEQTQDFRVSSEA